MQWISPSAAATAFFALIVAAGPSWAEQHCGIEAGKAQTVKMWDLPPNARKTTKELIVSIVLAHQKYRACKENRLTVILRIAGAADTIYLIKD